MNTSDKNKLNTGTNLTEKSMSKAEETELRRYFIKALLWVSGAAVSIIISVGGLLYKQMYEQVSELKAYRIEHQEESKRILLEYSSRITRLESDVQTIQKWHEESVKESRSNQKEILEAISKVKGDIK